MTQHTPGPWRLYNEKQDVYLRTVISKGWLAYPSKKTICSIRPYPRTSEAYAEGEANARLIAAAPDLLAALKEMMRVCEPPSEDDDADCFVLARAAIAKAEGE